jgi:hypothetical protein
MSSIVATSVPKVSCSPEFQLTKYDFDSCIRKKKDSQYVYDRMELLNQAAQLECPEFTEERFLNYTSQPYKRNRRGRKGEWRDHFCISYARKDAVIDLAHGSVQIQGVIHSSDFSCEIWIDWLAPDETWMSLRRSGLRNRDK